MRPVAARVAVSMLALTLFAQPEARGETEAIDCAERMAQHAGAWRALPPGTATRLKSAISGGEPELHLFEANLVCDEIDAVICTRPEGEGSCAHLLLSDPDRGCQGPVAGPYCVAWEDSLAPAELRQPILDRLKERAPRDVWMPVERSARASSSPDQARADAALWPMAVSLLALLILLGLGVALGRWTGAPLAARTGVPLAAGLLLAWFAPTISTWDLLGATALVCGACWLTGRREPLTYGLWARVIGVFLVCVVLLEGAVRLLLPTPPQSPPPQQARLVFTPEARESACRALYPKAYPDALPTMNNTKGRVVVHLGDSMVFGTGVSPGARFTQLLDQKSPDAHHLNAGFPGTGPDHHLSVLRAWLPSAKPDAVILYLYPGNDLVDMDRAYACCDHGPLLGAKLETRCQDPRWSFPMGALLARSPAPYPLRAASSHLHLAAHLSATFSRLTAALEPSLGDAAGTEEAEAAWDRYTGALGAIRDLAAEHQVTLTAVLLPTRVVLEPGAAPSHAQGVGDRMLKIAQQESLQVLDARPWITPLAQDGSYAHLFGDGVTWDEHLSEAGHRSLADWLFERL